MNELVQLGGQPVVAVKPLTSMNLSGQAVAQVMSYFRCDPAGMVVLHDEPDLMWQAHS